MASLAATLVMKTIEKKLHINEMLKTATEENLHEFIPDVIVGPRKVKVPRGYSMEIVTLPNGVGFNTQKKRKQRGNRKKQKFGVKNSIYKQTEVKINGKARI